MDARIQSFKDLLVWQEGHKLVIMVYNATKSFPKNETFGLSSQMQRAAVSITSNIAEGFCRQSFKEKNQFFSTARGSLTEPENQLLVAKDVNYISGNDFDSINNQLISVHRLLNAFIAKTKSFFPHSKFHIPNSTQKGFTLIEAVVSTAVFAVVIVSILGVYMSTIQLDRKSRAQRAVAQNARFIMEFLAKEVRNGTVFYGGYPGGIVNGTGTLAIENQDTTVSYYTLQGTDINLEKTNPGNVTTKLNSAGVKVTKLKFYIQPVGDPYTFVKAYNEQPRVTVTMELQSNYGTRANDIMTLDLQDTFATRNYPSRQMAGATGSPGQSHINLSPASFNFSATMGGGAPPAQSLGINNTGSVDSNWTGSTNQGWCHVTASGTAAAGSSSTASVSVDAPSSVGTFNCTVTISDANADNSPQTAAVTYIVSAANKSHIVLNPNSFSFNAASGDPAPPAQIMTISNTGNATLNASTSTDQNWCHVTNPPNIPSNSSANVSITVDAPSNVGSFTCHVSVTGPNADNSPQTAAVTYTVTAASPILSWTGPTNGSQDLSSNPVLAFTTPGTYTVTISRNTRLTLKGTGGGGGGSANGGVNGGGGGGGGAINNGLSVTLNSGTNYTFVVGSGGTGGVGSGSPQQNGSTGGTSSVSGGGNILVLGGGGGGTSYNFGSGGSASVGAGGFTGGNGGRGEASAAGVGPVTAGQSVASGTGGGGGGGAYNEFYSSGVAGASGGNGAAAGGGGGSAPGGGGGGGGATFSGVSGQYGGGGGGGAAWQNGYPTGSAGTNASGVGGRPNSLFDYNYGGAGGNGVLIISNP